MQSLNLKALSSDLVLVHDVDTHSVGPVPIATRLRKCRRLLPFCVLLSLPLSLSLSLSLSQCVRELSQSTKVVFYGVVNRIFLRNGELSLDLQLRPRTLLPCGPCLPETGSP